MTTIATLFSGFDLVSVGARSAGIEHIWGIEIDPEISAVARANGFNQYVMDILETDPRNFERPDILHASPECQRASLANPNRGETALDRAFGDKVSEFIEILQPDIFTLENVWLYRNFKAWHKIDDTLNRLGYWVDVAHVNAADMGVPQSRRRMIVRALKGRMVPHLPEPVPHIGWYASIEDILDTLPESKFADWQLSRLPDELLSDAFLVHPTDFRTMPVVDQDDPSFTIMKWSSGRQHSSPRAFLVDGKLSSSGDKKVLQINDESEPSGTVVSAHSAFRDARAWLSQGHVVSMTPRALARFQSIPDWYELSGKNSLDAKGIGNAVPPLMMEKIYRGLMDK